MLYTFCPNCGVKTEWALCCSSCGAPIPLYDFDERLKAGTITIQGAGNTRAKQDASAEASGNPLIPVLIGIGAIGVIILGVTLFP